MTKFPDVKEKIDNALNNLEKSRGHLESANRKIKRQREDITPRETSDAGGISESSNISSDASSTSDTEAS